MIPSPGVNRHMACRFRPGLPESAVFRGLSPGFRRIHSTGALSQDSWLATSSLRASLSAASTSLALTPSESESATAARLRAS